MRLNLYWRGRDVIDVEVHVWRLRDDGGDDEPPTLQAAPHLACSELAAPMIYPDTTVRAFGFARRGAP